MVVCKRKGCFKFSCADTDVIWVEKAFDVARDSNVIDFQFVGIHGVEDDEWSSDKTW